MNYLETEIIEDVELSFKLLEFSIRTMCYAELEKIDIQIFGQDLQINLDKENVSYNEGAFSSNEDIVHASQMAVSTAFGSTAICLDCTLENNQSSETNIVTCKKIIQAVRNAFSHGIAAPKWYIKQYKQEVLNLSFIEGPEIDVTTLNEQPFSYDHLGGLAVWYRIKEYVINHVQNT